MGKAFASPRRLELLDLLAQAPRNVDELARASDQSTANTSQHLQALHAAGMVTRAREGTSVRYALAGDEALAAVAGAARRLRLPAGRGRARGARLPRRRGRRGRPRRADRPTAQGRHRARRRAPRRGVRGRPHRGRALDPDRRARETGWPSCRPTASSWPTAAGRSAPTRTTPSASCRRPAGRRGASRTAGRNGGSQAGPPSGVEPRDDRRGHQMRATSGTWMRRTSPPRATASATPSAASSPSRCGSRPGLCLIARRRRACARSPRRWCSRSARSASSRASPPAVRSTISWNLALRRRRRWSVAAAQPHPAPYAFMIATAWLSVVGTPAGHRCHDCGISPRRFARRGLRDGDFDQPLRALRDVRLAGPAIRSACTPSPSREQSR